MKKLNLLFIALALVLTSCSKDDEASEEFSGDLVGTWESVSLNYTGSSSYLIEGNEISSTFIAEGYDVDFTITISENPNLITSIGTYSVELTTTTFGETIVQNVENVAFQESNTSWSRPSENQLAMTDEFGETFIYTIVELTTTSLKLTLSDNRNISEGPFLVNASTDTTVTFVR